MTKPTKEMLKEYAAIAKASNRNMESCIRAHLVANCPKFYGNEADRSRCAPTDGAVRAMAAWQEKFIKIKKTKSRKEAA